MTAREDATSGSDLSVSNAPNRTHPATPGRLLLDSGHLPPCGSLATKEASFLNLAFGDKEGAGVRRQETSRGMEAGRRMGPRRRVAVPAPEEKQGLRGEPDDGVAADRVACPAGGEEHVSRQGRADTHIRVGTGIAAGGRRGCSCPIAARC